MSVTYTKEQLEKIHSTEVEILSEIIRVCSENDIPWFTVGGTTLGAVRHNGFIPWDDDIDIGMLREDYDKFLALAPSCLKEGYILQHFTVDKRTPTYFAKVRKDGTEFIEYSNHSLPIHHGVFVDIMPYDRIPEDQGYAPRGAVRRAPPAARILQARHLRHSEAVGGACEGQ